MAHRDSDLVAAVKELNEDIRRFNLMCPIRSAHKFDLKESDFTLGKH